MATMMFLCSLNDMIDCLHMDSGSDFGLFVISHRATRVFTRAINKLHWKYWTIKDGAFTLTGQFFLRLSNDKYVAFEGLSCSVLNIYQFIFIFKF